MATSMIDAALSSGCLAQGRLVETLERRFAELTEARFALALNSGTSALEAALLALDVRGRKVIVPADTFVATAAAVINAGGTPVICDIAGPTEPVLDPKEVAALIDKDTAGVIVVHIGGFVWPQVSELAKICRERDVFMLEDAAHAHGAKLGDKPAGSLGDAAAFSLFPTKVITAGEGGVLVTSDRQLLERSTRFASHGRMAAAEPSETAGHNYRMSEISAAVALAHLSDAGPQTRARRRAARAYTEALATAAGISVPEPPQGCQPNWYKYIAIVGDGHDREWFATRLAGSGVSLSGAVFEMPLTKVPVLRKYVHAGAPNAERFCATHICLPIYGDMKPPETERVIEALRRTT